MVDFESERKHNEREYLKKRGPAVQQHALNKPFSDQLFASNLFKLGAVVSLMPDPPCTVLDMGCGSGWTSTFFSLRGYAVTGVDIAADMISLANINKERYGTDTIFIESDYEKLSYKNEFDCVVFFDSLHHAWDETAALSRAYAALKPGGICVASEPGYFHDKSLESKRVVQAYGTTEKSMPPKKIKKIAQKIGFRKVKIYPKEVYLQAILYDFKYYQPSNKLFQLLFRFWAVRMFALFFVIIGKKYSGIVVLKK